MKFWWVNHKQTFKSELGGGYIWSPIKNNGGSSNQGYKNLTLATIGDIIFSYANTYIKAIGIVETAFKEASVPPEFGTIGDQWEKDGYLVKVNWTLLEHPFKPKQHIDEIKDILPSKYSPIQKNGNGNQGIYLANISEELSDKLIDLINQTNNFVKPDIEEITDIIEDNVEQKKIEESSLPNTDKLQLIKARLGQGIFKSNVSKVEKGCRITKLNDHRFLTASHIKPWSRSTKFEKLDGNNGFLFSPNIDRLFDKGWISFADNGDLLYAKDFPSELVKLWDISINNVGAFNKNQMVYLEYHRENIFRDSRIRH